MSRGEIAEYLDVSLSTVKQYKNFPAPDVVIGRNQGWAKDTIDDWLKTREAK
jgi:predicted DNA-binding transcriptional regulator AlpA